jgi:D-serine deaminase-like pyridoxal phosphate-dependent protein
MWYKLENIEEVDSPSLVIYKDRVKENIVTLIDSIDDVNRLRPHVKTHKSAEVTQMMLHAGISKFKCATIAEAEMLATVGAKDILLAHQPVGPKMQRLLTLIQQFPSVHFSTIVDDKDIARSISDCALSYHQVIDVYIDLNVGMNRTGIVAEDAYALYQFLTTLKGLQVVGLHAYDGHLRDTDLALRKQRCDEAFLKVQQLQQQIENENGIKLVIVAGGTPTYSIHSQRPIIECSPGTFIYWDKGYEQILQEQHYLHAALVITRVVSIPLPGTICVDLGHKAIASENPLQQRVFFLNAPDLVPTGHSEEHMVFKTSHENYKVGDVLYGIPYHVCPTIALHDRAGVAEDHRVTAYWQTRSRNRRITV